MIGIGDFDGKGRNTRKICTRVGQMMYMGKKYSVEEKTGYLVCTSGNRQRLHDAIWEHENKREVPPGHVVHHIDWNKTHNYIENLTCVSVEGHNLIHNPGVGETRRVVIVPGGISEVVSCDDE